MALVNIRTPPQGSTVLTKDEGQITQAKLASTVGWGVGGMKPQTKSNNRPQLFCVDSPHQGLSEQAFGLVLESEGLCTCLFMRLPLPWVFLGSTATVIQTIACKKWSLSGIQHLIIQNACALPRQPYTNHLGKL